MPPSGLELWLQEGRKIRIGPKEFYLMPMPLSKFRYFRDWLDTTTKDVILQALKEEKNPGPWSLVIDVVKQVDIYDFILKAFDRKDPDTGEPINKGLNREYLEEYLDTPTTRKIIFTFIEVNDLEEALKNLQRLPMVNQILEAVKQTFGLPFLKHLDMNMASVQPTLEGSASPKSASTSEAASEGTPESGPQQEEQSKPQYKM